MSNHKDRRRARRELEQASDQVAQADRQLKVEIANNAAMLTPQPETVLKEAERLINGPRRADYGDAKESFDKIAAGWSVIIGVPVSGKQVALAMAWLKLCRALSSQDRDSLTDLAGYTGLAARLAGFDE